MATTTVDFSFGTAGNTVSASDDAVILDVGNDPTYRAETLFGGTIAVEFDAVWDRVRLDLGSTVGEMYFSIPMEITDPNTGHDSHKIAQVQAASGGEGVAQLRMNAARQIELVDKAAIINTSTYVVPTGTSEIRLEWHVDRAGLTQEVKIYDAAVGGTLQDTLTGACDNSTTTTFAELRLGSASNTSSDDRTWLTDQVAWDPDAYPGGGTPPVAVAAHTTTRVEFDTAGDLDTTVPIEIDLDGTGSTDTTAYLWTLVYGGTGSFDNDTSATPTWTAAAGETGPWSFQVEATGAGSDTDTVVAAAPASDGVSMAIDALLVPSGSP